MDHVRLKLRPLDSSEAGLSPDQTGCRDNITTVQFMGKESLRWSLETVHHKLISFNWLQIPD